MEHGALCALQGRMFVTVGRNATPPSEAALGGRVLFIIGEAAISRLLRKLPCKVLAPCYLSAFSANDSLRTDDSHDGHHGRRLNRNPENP